MFFAILPENPPPAEIAKAAKSMTYSITITPGDRESQNMAHAVEVLAKLAAAVQRLEERLAVVEAKS